ncbi:MAG: serine hydrolase domain-containing protein [Litorimonas sp.]
MNATVTRLLILCGLTIYGLWGLGPMASAQMQGPDRSSAAISDDALTEFVKTAMAKFGVPGAAVVAFDADGVTYAKAFGRADASGRAVTLDTPFQLASVSKSFVALILMQMVGEDRLSLDDPVTLHLPELSGESVVDWSGVTIRHLLSHRSGLSTFDGNRWQSAQSDSLEDVIGQIAELTPHAEPGEAFQYSNANYILASAVIERVGGQPFERAITARIFEPLDMRNSYVQRSTRPTVAEAAGFRQWYGRAVERPFLQSRAMMGAGGVVSSARYLAAVAREDPAIVPPGASADLFRTVLPVTGFEWSYGLGWQRAEEAGRTVIYHSGLNPGIATHAAFLPDSGTGVVVLTNLSGSLTADVPHAVSRKALGLPTGPIAPSGNLKVLLWAITGLAIVLCLGALNALRVMLSAYEVHGGFDIGQTLRLIVPTVVLCGLAYALLGLVPMSNGAPLSAIRVFQPDAWLALVVGGVSALAWALLRWISFVRTRRSVPTRPIA